MSVLQIVGMGVGAVAGFAIGGPAGALTGAALGGTIGSVANSIINPTHTEGARLGDLTVQSSAFGSVRPIGYGKIRISGNVIWALPLQEHATTSSAGKAGGKGGPTTTTFTYGATFALALCEGPADAVLRIWADSKLVYDASGGSDTIQRPGFNFRFYPGDGTQTADSIIEADRGVGNVPGYRGTCYLVFDDIPLADYGNRIPSVTAEVVFNATPAFDFTRLVRATGTIFGAVDTQGLAVNPVSRIGYVWGQSPTGLIEFSVDTMQTLRERALTDILAGLGSGDTGGADPASFANQLVGDDQAFYFITADTVHGPHIVRVDPTTLLATAEFRASRDLTGFTTTNFWFANRLCFIAYLDPTAGLVSNLLVSTIFNDIGLLTVPGLTYAGGLIAGVPVAVDGSRCDALCQGKIGAGAGEAWQLTRTGDTLFIVQTVLAGASFGTATVATFVPTDFDPAGVHISLTYGFPGGLIYDEGDDSLLFQVDLTDVSTAIFSVLVKWSPASGLVFSVRVPWTGISLPSASPSRISGGTYARLGTDGNVIIIDAATGAISSTTGWPIDLGTGGFNNQAYDSADQIIIAFTTESGSNAAWTKLRLGRATGAGTTLGAIFLDQCERATFTSGDVDTGALTDAVDGFVISQPAMVSDVLSPLMGAYLVDAVELNGVLTFVHRGGAIAAALVQDDLVRISDAQEPFTETRQQEIELPMRVTFSYIDSDRDYQTNTQAAKRARAPNPTVQTDNQTDLSLAVVTTATPAKQMAERILYSVWNERASFTARLAPKFSGLNVADPVTLTLDDGYVIRGRLGKADLGVDYSLDVTIIEETTGQYVSAAVADPGVPWSGNQAIGGGTTGGTVTAVPASKLILLDTPLLRDADDLGGAAMRTYWGGASYVTTGGWPGAQLQASPEAATWTTIDASPDEVTWGAVETPAPDPVSPWRTQFGATMTIQVAGGAYVPTATDDLGLANLANPMAVIKANGEVEIIQYRDVTALGGGRYTLGTFYRGVRGTDAMAGGLALGDTIVFLSTAGVRDLAIPLADHNVNEFYRLITTGALSSSALPQGFTFHGRDLMPYAPVHGAATVTPGGDIVLSWVRRTRFGGELRDGIDTVPLNEQGEAYEIDILTGPGGSVRRTLTATGPTVTYPVANIAADFGSGGRVALSSLSVRIYQISAVVGRGFATEELLLVADIATAPSIALTSVPAVGVAGTGVSIAFSYDVIAPSGLVALWQPGNIAGSVSGFTAGAGTGTATIDPPAIAGIYTLTVVGTGANAAISTAGNSTDVSAVGTPAVALASVPTASAVSTSIGVVFTYTVATPSGITAVWNPGGITATVAGFSASGGNGTATVETPGSAATYTLTVTGTGANTGSDTAGNTTVVSSAAPTITATSIPASGALGGAVNVTFDFTVAAPSGLTAIWNPGAIPAVVTGFSLSGGTGAATLAAPGTPGTYTATITGTGSNTASAIAPNTTSIFSGAYDNLAAWPSLSNRPVNSGGTLTWIGPLAGGASTSADMRQSLGLTTSGAVVTTADNQVISGLSIAVSGQACVTVRHNNCIVRRNYLKFAQWNGVAVVVSPGTTGTIIEDNHCFGSSDGSGNYGITGDTGGGSTGPVNAIVRRNNMHGSEKCVGQTLNNMTILDNFFHGSSGNDNDYIDAWCVQAGSSNSSITHNYFDGSDSDGNDDSCLSCLNYGTAGTITGITFSGNACALTVPAHMAHQVIFDQHYTAHGGSGGQSGGLSGIVVTNNGFYGSAVPAAVDNTIVFDANSGNYIMATPLATSGALVNGTGVL